jgi:RHS repeat-associated protein
LITDATLPGNVGQLTQTVDIMGRRTSVCHGAFREERTAFDPVGCCLERTIDGTREVFAYDFLSQLTNDNGRSASYDSLNRRCETEGTAASHNARHQILSQGENHFHYDSDGRRTFDDRFKYSYDACDRLTAVEDDTTRYEYTYDPFNRRMSSIQYVKEEESWKQCSKKRFIWHDECEIGSADEESRIQELRILGEGLGGKVGAAVAFEVNGEVFVPIHDLSGHVRACVNMNGDVVEKLTYTAFGLESRNAHITPWTFSSKRQDEETGFLYFGRRFYEPSTATWLTQDPLGISAGPNLYAYVKNNPLTC